MKTLPTHLIAIATLAITGCAALSPLGLAERRYNTTYVETSYDPDEATGWKGYTSDYVRREKPLGTYRGWHQLQLNINNFSRLIIRFKSVASDWHFFKKAYANGQELDFEKGAGKVVVCSPRICIHEYFFVYVPIGMALDSACTQDGLTVAAIGEFRRDITVKPETIHAFLSKARSLGARIERPMCNYPPILQTALQITQ